MPTNRLTDIQEICKHLEKENKHLRNVSKKIQKDISSKTGDIFNNYNVTKKVSQLTKTNIQKFLIIWK